jgi:hypothetical protein
MPPFFSLFVQNYIEVASYDVSPRLFKILKGLKRIPIILFFPIGHWNVYVEKIEIFP